MADYGLALAPTPKILTYGPTRTSRRWHGMQEGWQASGWLGIKGMYIYIYIVLCKEGSTYGLGAGTLLPI